GNQAPASTSNNQSDDHRNDTPPAAPIDAPMPFVTTVIVSGPALQQVVNHQPNSPAVGHTDPVQNNSNTQSSNAPSSNAPSADQSANTAQDSNTQDASVGASSIFPPASPPNTPILSASQSAQDNTSTTTVSDNGDDLTAVDAQLRDELQKQL